MHDSYPLMTLLDRDVALDMICQFLVLKDNRHGLREMYEGHLGRQHSKLALIFSMQTPSYYRSKH